MDYLLLIMYNFCVIVSNVTLLALAILLLVSGDTPAAVLLFIGQLCIWVMLYCDIKV